MSKLTHQLEHINLSGLKITEILNEEEYNCLNDLLGKLCQFENYFSKKNVDDDWNIYNAISFYVKTLEGIAVVKTTLQI